MKVNVVANEKNLGQPNIDYLVARFFIEYSMIEFYLDTISNKEYDLPKDSYICKEGDTVKFCMYKESNYAFKFTENEDDLIFNTEILDDGLTVEIIIDKQDIEVGKYFNSPLYVTMDNIMERVIGYVRKRF